MNKQFEIQVGQNIHRLREQACFTQEMLAAHLQVCGCDITRSALAKIEVGQRHIYPDELKKIKEILNISYEDLLWEPYPPSIQKTP